jgi:hypothetical protein
MQVAPVAAKFGDIDQAHGLARANTRLIRVSCGYLRAGDTL